MNFYDKQTKQFCNNSIDLYNVHVHTKTKKEQPVLCNTVYHTKFLLTGTFHCSFLTWISLCSFQSWTSFCSFQIGTSRLYASPDSHAMPYTDEICFNMCMMIFQKCILESCKYIIWTVQPQIADSKKYISLESYTALTGHIYLNLSQRHANQLKHYQCLGLRSKTLMNNGVLIFSVFKCFSLMYVFRSVLVMSNLGCVFCKKIPGQQ